MILPKILQGPSGEPIAVETCEAEVIPCEAEVIPCHVSAPVTPKLIGLRDWASSVIAILVVSLNWVNELACTTPLDLCFP